MKRFVAILALALLGACGTTTTPTASRGRTDVVTVEWTSGDDVPLTPRPPAR
jgi:hypothetical protein